MIFKYLLGICLKKVKQIFLCELKMGYSLNKMLILIHSTYQIQ
jgi:hypothetical protein